MVAVSVAVRPSMRGHLGGRTPQEVREIVRAAHVLLTRVDSFPSWTSLRFRGDDARRREATELIDIGTERGARECCTWSGLER